MATMFWVLLFYYLLPIKGEGGCRKLKFLKCMENKSLTGHIISTLRIEKPAQIFCQSKCFLEKRCISYNLGPALGQNRSCELNAADHSTRPSFLVNKTGYEYCPIQNPCLSSPCPAERLCTPDFSWNTYNCNDGGWTQWGPWTACACTSLGWITKRNRTCTNPVPRLNGTNCGGQDSQTKTCYKSEPKENSSGCTSPLGMEDRRIPDEGIKASSFFKYNYDFTPKTARLRGTSVTGDKGAGWAAAKMTTGDYLQVNLCVIKSITMVATQGRYSTVYNQWVTKYSLSYSLDDKVWKAYEEDGGLKIFSGNSDETTVVTNKLEKPIKTRHIRLTVKGFHSWPSMRMELYGC